MIRLPPRSTRTDTLFPYTTLFRSAQASPGRRANCHGMPSQEENPQRSTPTRIATQRDRHRTQAVGVAAEQADRRSKISEATSFRRLHSRFQIGRAHV